MWHSNGGALRSLLRPSTVLVIGLIAIVSGIVACVDEDEPPTATPTMTTTPTAEQPDAEATESPTEAGGVALLPTPPPGEGPHGSGEVGRAADDSVIARMDIDVVPGGEGLPDGSGTVADGAEVYALNCARCHGPSGTEAGVGPALVGEPGPWQPGMAVTIGSYWPYAETVFDYVRRSMPFDAPGSLTDDQVYAVVAWLLHENDVIDADAELNSETLPQVEMPNRDNFFSCWPEECRPDIE